MVPALSHAVTLPLRALALLFSLVGIGGCTVYQYDVVKPENLAGHVGDRDKVLELNPLVYRLRSVESRLVIRIYNPTDDPIQLLGPQSVVVDPHGQSHPLRSQTIAPKAFIKLIFPPPPPTVYENGPTFGIGFGVIGRAHYHDAFVGSGLYDEPRYYTVYDENDVTRWDWEGETDLRATFTYERANRTFHDEFLFHRRKKG